MENLNREFLQDLGMGDMSEAESIEFLGHLQEEVELRLGRRMREDLTEEQLEEFGRLADGDEAEIEKTLEMKNDYKNDSEYKNLAKVGGFTEGSPELLGEYANLIWLQRNYPLYIDIARDITKGLKEEIRAGNSGA